MDYIINRISAINGANAYLHITNIVFTDLNDNQMNASEVVDLKRDWKCKITVKKSGYADNYIQFCKFALVFENGLNKAYVNCIGKVGENDKDDNVLLNDPILKNWEKIGLHNSLGISYTPNTYASITFEFSSETIKNFNDNKAVLELVKFTPDSIRIYMAYAANEDYINGKYSKPPIPQVYSGKGYSEDLSIRRTEEYVNTIPNGTKTSNLLSFYGYTIAPKIENFTSARGDKNQDLGGTITINFTISRNNIKASENGYKENLELLLNDKIILTEQNDCKTGGNIIKQNNELFEGERYKSIFIITQEVPETEQAQFTLRYYTTYNGQIIEIVEAYSEIPFQNAHIHLSAATYGDEYGEAIGGVAIGQFSTVKSYNTSNPTTDEFKAIQERDALFEVGYRSKFYKPIMITSTSYGENFPLLEDSQFGQMFWKITEEKGVEYPKSPFTSMADFTDVKSRKINGLYASSCPTYTDTYALWRAFDATWTNGWSSNLNTIPGNVWIDIVIEQPLKNIIIGLKRRTINNIGVITSANIILGNVSFEENIGIGLNDPVYNAEEMDTILIENNDLNVFKEDGTKLDGVDMTKVSPGEEIIIKIKNSALYNFIRILPTAVNANNYATVGGIKISSENNYRKVEPFIYV